MLGKVQEWRGREKGGETFKLFGFSSLWNSPGWSSKASRAWLQLSLRLRASSVNTLSTFQRRQLLSHRFFQLHTPEQFDPVPAATELYFNLVISLGGAQDGAGHGLNALILMMLPLPCGAVNHCLTPRTSNVRCLVSSQQLVRRPLRALQGVR